jgi:hypothetical protein
MAGYTDSDFEKLDSFRQEWRAAGWDVIAEPRLKPFDEKYDGFMAALFSPAMIDETLARLNSQIVSFHARNQRLYKSRTPQVPPDPLDSVPGSEWMYHGETFVYDQTVSGVCALAVNRAIEVYGIDQVPKNPEELHALAAERVASL